MIRSSPVRLLFCFFSLGLAGCGGTKTVAVSESTPLPANRYHAYGDSITYGLLLTSASQAYPSLIASDRGLALSNYAQGGAQACDVPTLQIFANSDDPQESYPLYTLMIGTNDADHFGTGLHEVLYNQCHQASIAWLALPASLKVRADSAAVTTSGAGALNHDQNWNAWHTASAGSSVTFPITLAIESPIYLWPRIFDGDAGLFTYALDGKVLGTLSTGSVSPIQTVNGSTDSLSFMRIPNVAAGRHTVTFTQTSATGSMEIVGIGAPPESGSLSLPVVVVGEVPLQEPGSPAPCALDASICDAYIADIQANVALFQADGLDVRFAENHTYMLATQSEMADALHPNALGHSELRYAFEALLSQRK